MNILIVAFFNKWVTHLGTELELAVGTVNYELTEKE